MQLIYRGDTYHQNPTQPQTHTQTAVRPYAVNWRYKLPGRQSHKQPVLIQFCVKPRASRSTAVNWRYQVSAS